MTTIGATSPVPPPYQERTPPMEDNDLPPAYQEQEPATPPKSLFDRAYYLTSGCFYLSAAAVCSLSVPIIYNGVTVGYNGKMDKNECLMFQKAEQFPYVTFDGAKPCEDYAVGEGFGIPMPLLVMGAMSAFAVKAMNASRENFGSAFS